jgi:DNA-binding NtrC family response regulator
MRELDAGGEWWFGEFGPREEESMDRPLRILIVEDDEVDAEIIAHQIRQAGYRLATERVDTRDAMIGALDRQEWDVILADYNMPRFSVPAALVLLEERNLDLPFIIISGYIDEAVAAWAMEMGADDFVPKNNLSRLVPVIERELSQSAGHRGTATQCRRVEPFPHDRAA